MLADTGGIPLSIISITSTPGRFTQRCRLQPHVSLSAASLSSPKMLPGQKLPLLSCGMREPHAGSWGSPWSPSGRDGCPQQAGIAACTGIPQQLQPTSQKHGSLGQGPGVSRVERIHGEWEGKRVGA